MRPSHARVRRALGRQEERAAATLKRITEWPAGMPPLAAIGSGLGILTLLERRGLVRPLARDRLGDLRFVLTRAGRRQVGEAAPSTEAR